MVVAVVRQMFFFCISDRSSHVDGARECLFVSRQHSACSNVVVVVGVVVVP